jgi:hypothetical protein
MRRRQIITLAGGGSAVLLAGGTGALSSVRAERSLVIGTTEDADAYLSLNANPEGFANSAYAKEVDGVLEIDITEGTVTSESEEGEDVTSDGINPYAATVIEEIFSIENQGTNTVEVSVTIENEDFNSDTGVDFIATNVPEKPDGFKSSLLEGSENLPRISPGDSFAAGLEIDTTGDNLTDLEDLLTGLQVTIQAIAIPDGGSS